MSVERIYHNLIRQRTVEVANYVPLRELLTFDAAHLCWWLCTAGQLYM